MAEVFGRKYELLIGKPRTIIRAVGVNTVLSPELVSASKDIKVITPLIDGSHDYLSIASVTEGTVITDLNMEAEIEYNREKTSSSNEKGKIKIYNLSKDSLENIESEGLVVLKAGYNQDPELPVIFVGQIISVVTTRSGADLITELVCKDSYIPLKDRRINISIAPKSLTYRDVFELFRVEAKRVGLASVFKETKNTDSSRALDAILINGYNIEGGLFSNLLDLCASTFYRAYISIGVLYIEPINTNDDDVDDTLLDIIDLKADTIINSIEPLKDTASKGLQSTNEKSGIKVKTFLNGKFTTSVYLRVDKELDKAGLYKISSVKHSLKFEGTGADWNTDIEAKTVGG